MERQVSTIHINKFVDLPDGSTVQIVASGPLLTFLVIQKQQNGSRVLYVQGGEREGPQHHRPRYVSKSKTDQKDTFQLQYFLSFIFHLQVC